MTASTDHRYKDSIWVDLSIRDGRVPSSQKFSQGSTGVHVRANYNHTIIL